MLLEIFIFNLIDYNISDHNNKTNRSISNITQRNNFKSHRQRLVGPPMWRQDCANKKRATSPYQFPRMFRHEVAEGPFRQNIWRHLGVGVLQDALGCWWLFAVRAGCVVCICIVRGIGAICVPAVGGRRAGIVCC